MLSKADEEAIARFARKSANFDKEYVKWLRRINRSIRGVIDTIEDAEDCLERKGCLQDVRKEIISAVVTIQAKIMATEERIKEDRILTQKRGIK